MKGILFLCVANSARSQMAEGIARTLVPPGVRIASAGSNPTSLRPEAVAVLAEIGIDISVHVSKSVAEIPWNAIDTVVTLCAEEICPRVPDDVRHLHWNLADPSAVTGSEQDRLAAFRRTRDELQQRIKVFLAAEQTAGRLS